MAIANQPREKTRLVVVLKASEKRRVQSLARKQQLSSSELMRRSFHDYAAKSVEDPDEAEVRLAIAEMNDSLDKALVAVRSARLEVAENIAQMRRLRGE